jgi:hypothetical protein
MEDWLGELIGIDPNSTTSNFGNNYTSNADLFTQITGGGGNSNLLSTIGGILSGKSGSTAQLAGLGGIGALLNSFGGGGGGSGGYAGRIPKYKLDRKMNQIPTTMTNAAGQTVPRRPGSGGVNYFSPARFSPAGQTPTTAVGGDTTAGPTGTPMVGSGISGLGDNASKFVAIPSELVAAAYPSGGVDPNKYKKPADTGMGDLGGDRPFSHVYTDEHRASDEYLRRINPTFKADKESAMAALAKSAGAEKFAQGGITTLGGYSDGGRLLRGPGDGVSDSIPAMIGKNQPARLADGEFVIPARIVSEIGNGSTEAGARKLYAMMDRIQKARRKTLKNVAANTKADKHLPA